MRSRSNAMQAREDREADLHPHRGHVPALRGHGHGHRHRPRPSCSTTPSRSPRARSPSPATRSDSWWTVRIFTESGFLDPNKPIRDYTEQELARLPLQGADQGQGQGRQPHLRGPVPKVQKSFLQKDKDALQPHIRAFVDRAVTFTACPECGGTRLNEAAPRLADRRHQHRRCLRHADQRPRRVGPRHRPNRRWRRCSRRCGRPSTRSSRSGSATSRSTGRRARCRAARRSAPR